MENAYSFRTEQTTDNVNITSHVDTHDVYVSYPPDEESKNTISNLSKYKSFVNQFIIMCSDIDDSVFEIYLSMRPSGGMIQFLKIVYENQPTRPFSGIDQFNSDIEGIHIVTPRPFETNLDSRVANISIRLSNFEDNVVKILGPHDSNVADLENSTYIEEEASLIYLNKNILSHAYPQKEHVISDAITDSDVSFQIVSPQMSTINLFDLKFQEQEMNIEIDEKEDSIDILGIPPNIETLRFGKNLSESIRSCSSLPNNLRTYSGPYIHDLSLPETISKLTLIYTRYSIPSKLMHLPSNVVSLEIITTNKITDVDEIILPKNLQYIKFIGDTNISLENLHIPESVNIIEKPTKMTNPGIISKDYTINHDNVIISSSEKVEEMISKGLPLLSSIPNFYIRTDKTLCEIWTDILFEGSVPVGNLLIDGTQNTLKNASRVFDRSFQLKRPICLENLIVRGLHYSKDMDLPLLNIARSLNKLNNIQIIFEFENLFNSDLIRPIAKLLNMESVESPNGFTYKRLYGSIESLIHGNTKDNRYILTISKGHGPKYFNKLKNRPVASAQIPDIPVIPVAPNTLNVPLFPIIPVNPDIIGNIKVYLWSNCGYCVKQKSIIENVRVERSDFDTIVEVVSVDDPSVITDSRIDSFPSWVVNDVVQPGVKEEKEILSLF